MRPVDQEVRRAFGNRRSNPQTNAVSFTIVDQPRVPTLDIGTPTAIPKIRDNPVCKVVDKLCNPDSTAIITSLDGTGIVSSRLPTTRALSAIDKDLQPHAVYIQGRNQPRHGAA
jgi:hypothetical protein